MTPNPHPASGNGDVIERLRNSRLFKDDTGLSHVFEPDELHKEAADEIERLRGLLKLSEGSGDGKMREVLLIARRYVAAEHDRLWSRAAKAQVKPDLRKIDAALDGGSVCSPAPSPIDAEGMREACALKAEDTARHHRSFAESQAECRPVAEKHNAIAVACETVAARIRALPTPAREIDRSEMARKVAARISGSLQNHSINSETELAKIIEAELIGGRHV